MFELDHVVYFTKKSPTEIVQEEAYYGIKPVIGGQHLHWGTNNALFYTKSSYVEWLAIENLKTAQSSNHPLIQQLIYDLKEKEGFATLCLRSKDLEKINSYFKQLGYKTSEVLPAERKTASGEIRRWKMLFIQQKIDNSLPYPFFIQWEQDDEERFQTLRNENVLREENEELTIQRCVFHVKDVEKKLTQWSRLLSLPVSGNQLKLANTTFEFLQSTDEKERLQDVEVVKTWTIE